MLELYQDWVRDRIALPEQTLFIAFGDPFKVALDLSTDSDDPPAYVCLGRFKRIYRDSDSFSNMLYQLILSIKGGVRWPHVAWITTKDEARTLNESIGFLTQTSLVRLPFSDSVYYCGECKSGQTVAEMFENRPFSVFASGTHAFVREVMACFPQSFRRELCR